MNSSSHMISLKKIATGSWKNKHNLSASSEQFRNASMLEKHVQKKILKLLKILNISNM